MYQMWATVFRFHVIINREGLTDWSGKSIAFVGNQSASLRPGVQMNIVNSAEIRKPFSWLKTT